MRSSKALLATACLAALPGLAQAQTAGSPAVSGDEIAAAIEKMSPAGREAYAVYDKLGAPKAFAMAEDGAIGYSAGRGDPAQMRAEALARCTAQATSPCRIIAENGETLVGDRRADEALDTLKRRYSDSSDLRGEVIADYEKAEGAKALALSPDGAYGWTVQATLDEARTEALRQCQAWGSDCALQDSATASAE